MGKAGKQKPFYEISGYTGNLREGGQIDVTRQILYLGENADFTPFLEVPHKELENRLKSSMAEEKKVYNELQTAVKAWDEHGAQTLLLKRAIEYVKTPPVKHTANEWKQHKDGVWEISNLVYKMTFKITKRSDEWKLAWELQYTAPGLPENRYYSPYGSTPLKRIEYEGSKKYKTIEGAQKYVQSKFDQYAPCFETLSPPVPQAVKSLFCVNGQLLQGYSLAHPERTEPDKAVVEALLASLVAVDITGPEQAAAPPTTKEQTAKPAPKPQRPTGKKNCNHKKKAPAR